MSQSVIIHKRTHLSVIWLFTHRTLQNHWLYIFLCTLQSPLQTTVDTGITGQQTRVKIISMKVYLIHLSF